MFAGLRKVRFLCWLAVVVFERVCVHERLWSVYVALFFLSMLLVAQSSLSADKPKLRLVEAA